MMEIIRDADGTFKCKCDKKFKLPTSLRRLPVGNVVLSAQI